MPVDVTRVKGKLKEIFPKVNLSTKRLDEISARLATTAADDADDAAIAKIVNTANSYMPFDDIAREDDRIRTLEANQQKPPANPDDKKGQNGNPQPPDRKDDETVPAWAKTMIEANDNLLKKVSSLEKGNIVETKKAEARKLFEADPTLKGLPEKSREYYVNQIQFESETPLADQVTGISEVVKEIIQANADSMPLPGRPPVGAPSAPISEADMDKIISNARK